MFVFKSVYDGCDIEKVGELQQVKDHLWMRICDRRSRYKGKNFANHDYEPISNKAKEMENAIYSCKSLNDIHKIYSDIYRKEIDLQGWYEEI